MSDYTPILDYSAKDALTSGDPEKIVLGADIDAELAAIQTAIGTKYDVSDIASQAEAEAGSLNTVLMTPGRTGDWANGNAGIVGDLQALADPNADRILFWDDSAGSAALLSTGTGIAISGTSISLSFLGLQSLTDPNADRIFFWDDSAGASKFLAPDGTTITISGTTISTGSNVPLLNASNTFTSSGGANTTAALRINAAAPWMRFSESDQAVDSRDWLMGTTSGVFVIGAPVNDADISTSGNGIKITRSGANVSSIAFVTNSGTITFDGVARTDFARLSQANTFQNDVTVSSTNPKYWLIDTAAAADEGKWAWDLNVNQWGLYPFNDAGTAGTPALLATRTGNTVTELDLAATTIKLNSVDVSTYVQNTRTVTAGSGLTGGGALSANITLNVGAGTGISVLSNSIELNHLGLEDLSDAGADRIMFWDDSFGGVQWLSVSGMTISGTTLSINQGSGSGLDADTLDAHDSTYYTNMNNAASGTLSTARGGTGQTSELAYTRRVTLNWTIASDPGTTPSGTAGDVFAYY